MHKSQSKHRSPIRDAPLRDPGESLRDQIEDRLYGQVFPWLIVTLMFIVVTCWEWLYWWMDSRPSPVYFTIETIILVGFAGWQWRRGMAAITPLKLGRVGERAVGQFLQATLIPMGYTVIHDVCFDDFNVDHVAIGPGGVFAIEVKTRSKPERGEVRVHYDGTRILVNGLAPDRDPIVQVKAGARSIRDVLVKYAGVDTAVQGVVLFPKWWIEGSSSGKEIWVLNEGSFAKFIKNERVKLSEREIRVLAEALARYVRDNLE